MCHLTTEYGGDAPQGFASGNIDRLLQVFPSAQTTWENYRQDYSDGEQRLYYIEVSAFARQLVDNYACGHTQEFDALFELVESVIQQGDHEARALVIVSLLEDLQNIASHRSPGYVVFEPWRRPRSFQAWRELEAMWNGKGGLADVILAERR